MIIENFFRKKDIYLIKNNGVRGNLIKDCNIEDYLDILNDFHKRLREEDEILSLSIGSTIGKYYEWCNVMIRRIKREHKNILYKKDLNRIEEMYLEIFPKVIEVAEGAIKSINYSDYIEIIKRAMRRNELILGNCSLDNIYKINDKIYIRDIESISFNSLEEDLILLINKLKKKKINYNLDNLINDYIIKENLNSISKNYIKAMTVYPSESMKVFEKIRQGRKKWTEDESIKKIKASLKKDNISGV